MKIILLILISSIYSFSYEKGYIDTHGGKSDSLLEKSNFSKNINLNSPFNKSNKIEKKEKNQIKKTNDTKELNSINSFLQGK